MVASAEGENEAPGNTWESMLGKGGKGGALLLTVDKGIKMGAGLASRKRCMRSPQMPGGEPGVMGHERSQRVKGGMYRLGSCDKTP